MSAITIHPKDSDQEKVIQMFLDALKVKYMRSEDDTQYLLSSAANVKHLERSIQQAENGNTRRVDLDDIWK